MVRFDQPELDGIVLRIEFHAFRVVVSAVMNRPRNRRLIDFAITMNARHQFALQEIVAESSPEVGQRPIAIARSTSPLFTHPQPVLHELLAKNQ
jgi:hypothetical protein